MEDIEWMLHLDATVVSASQPQKQVMKAPGPLEMPTPKIG